MLISVAKPAVGEVAGCGRTVGGVTGAGLGVETGAGATIGGAASALGAGAAGVSPAAATSINKIKLPSDTRSPTLILSSVTVPATGEGISIEALSDSMVINEPSTETLSPTLTKTSITSTSLKLPISGTWISWIAITCLLMPNVD